ncbi:MAG: endonuclease domain-containing protein [Bacteroidota bacterium]|jgi:very-short-patch-repair endonuclease
MEEHTSKFFLQTTKSTIAKARALRKRMTPEEKLLWSRLRGKNFDVQFRKQVPFGPYIVDLFCLSKKIAIELDGDQHYEIEAKEYDKSRDEYLKLRGIKVLRFRNKELKTNLDGVLTQIWNACH